MSTTAPTTAPTLVTGRPITYSRALDGLRAVAVGGVLLYHAGVDWMPGGYLGVDAFFVLSGFLITSLLIGEWADTGRVRLAAFWARRARRLLPALFLVIAAVGIYAAFVATVGEFPDVRGDGLAALGYVANWRFVFSGQDYFDLFTAPSPFRHMWSLAIEEQFYFVWPLLLLGLLRIAHGDLRRVAGFVGALAAGSALLMVWLADSGRDPSRVYYGTDTRAQSLLIGALVAVAAGGIPVLGARARSVAHLLALGAAGVLGLMWSTADSTSSWLYEGGLTVAAIAVAVIIISVTQRLPGPIGVVLGLAPLVWVGRISYGLYLWHWPIYLVMTPDRTGLEGTELVLARIGVSVAFAVASYVLVERPIRTGFRSRNYAWALVPVAGAALAVMLVASPAIERPESAVSAAVALTRSTGPPPEVERQPRAADGAAAPADPTRVLVVGDSVALTLMAELDEALPKDLSVWNHATLGCGVARSDEAIIGGEAFPVSDVCNLLAEQWTRDLDEFDPEVVVFLVGAWDVVDRKVDGRWIRIGTPEFHDYMLAEVRIATDVLRSRGARVVVLTAPYSDVNGAPRDPTRDWPEFEPWRVDVLNQIYREVVDTSSGTLSLIDLNQRVSPGERFTDALEGVLIRDDGVHFTAAGSTLLSRWLAPQLLALDPTPASRP